MTAVKRGEASIAALIENVLRKRTESAGNKDLRRIIDELGVRIGAAKQQAVRELAIDGQLSGVIDRIPAISSHKDGAEIGIEADYVAVGIELAGAGIEILIDEETFAACSNICERQDEIAGEFALNVEVPLMGKRIAQVAGNRANGTRGAGGGREGGQNGGGIGNTAATGGIDCILNRIGRTGRGVIENIGEELVVKDAVTGANDGFVVSEKARPEVRCVGQADP